MRNPNASFEEELFCTSFYRNSVEVNNASKTISDKNRKTEVDMDRMLQQMSIP